MSDETKDGKPVCNNDDVKIDPTAHEFWDSFSIVKDFRPDPRYWPPLRIDRTSSMNEVAWREAKEAEQELIHDFEKPKPQAGQDGVGVLQAYLAKYHAPRPAEIVFIVDDTGPASLITARVLELFRQQHEKIRRADLIPVLKDPNHDPER